MYKPWVNNNEPTNSNQPRKTNKNLNRELQEELCGHSELLWLVVEWFSFCFCIAFNQHLKRHDYEQVLSRIKRVQSRHDTIYIHKIKATVFKVQILLTWNAAMRGISHFPLWSGFGPSINFLTLIPLLPLETTSVIVFIMFGIQTIPVGIIWVKNKNDPV